jgi:serine/threonine-protein kinase RsbW
MEQIALGMAQYSHLSISSDVSNLGEVADFIVDAARESGLNEAETYRVQMAVDEAVTNVIQHAYHGVADGRIEIFCERRGRDFIVEIVDFGKPFDASQVPIPRVRGPLSRRNIGGLGVFFMKKLMDKVEFSHGAESGNRVRMVKRIK